MKTILNYLTLLTVMFCSTSNLMAQNSSLITTDVTIPDFDKLEDVYLSEIADRVDYIALSDKAPIRMEDYNSLSFKIINGSILANIDSRNYLFNKKGEYVTEIVNAGKYINQNSVMNGKLYSLNPDNNTISIHNVKKNRSNAIKDDNIFSRYPSIFSINDNLLLLYYEINDYKGKKPGAQYKLYDIKSKSVIDSIPDYHNLKKPPKTSFGVVSYVVSDVGDKSYFMNIHSDTLFSVTDKKITSSLVLNRGMYQFNIQEMYNKGIGKLDMFKNSVLIPSGVIRVQNKLYVKYKYDYKEFMYVVNLDDMSVKYCKPYFINDIDNGPNFSLSQYSNGVSSINVGSYKKNPGRYSNKPWVSANVKNENRAKDSDKFRRLVDISTEHSNPILQIIKIKK